MVSNSLTRSLFSASFMLMFFSLYLWYESITSLSSISLESWSIQKDGLTVSALSFS